MFFRRHLKRLFPALAFAALLALITPTALATPSLVEMQVISQGGQVFTPPAKWVDVLQCSTTHAEYNVTTARSNMSLAAGLPLFVIISADGPYWTNFFGTAVIPVGNTTNGTGSEFAPNQRYLDASVTSISFVCAANQNISLQFYRP